MKPGTRPPRGGRPGRVESGRPPHKDWTEARQAGIDLRRWWADRLGGIEAPDSSTHDEPPAPRGDRIEGTWPPAPGIAIRPARFLETARPGRRSPDRPPARPTNTTAWNARPSWNSTAV